MLWVVVLPVHPAGFIGVLALILSYRNAVGLKVSQSAAKALDVFTKETKGSIARTA
jgi:hypothetical protein